MPCGFFYLHLFSFFSSRNLSGHRVDVYHTSTHGVALVRISDAGLKCAAHSSLGIQHAKMTQKNRHLGTITQLCWAVPVSSQLRHRQSEKNLLSSNTTSTCPRNMVNFGPLTAEIGSGVWGTPENFNGFRVGSLTARHSTSGHQPNFVALNRGRHMYSAVRPSRWALADIRVVQLISIFNCVQCP